MMHSGAPHELKNLYSNGQRKLIKTGYCIFNIICYNQNKILLMSTLAKKSNDKIPQYFCSVSTSVIIFHFYHRVLNTKVTPNMHTFWLVKTSTSQIDWCVKKLISDTDKEYYDCNPFKTKDKQTSNQTTPNPPVRPLPDQHSQPRWNTVHLSRSYSQVWIGLSVSAMWRR